jgi:hypothetical protein
MLNKCLIDEWCLIESIELIELVVLMNVHSSSNAIKSVAGWC